LYFLDDLFGKAVLEKQKTYFWKGFFGNIEKCISEKQK